MQAIEPSVRLMWDGDEPSLLGKAAKGRTILSVSPKLCCAIYLFILAW